MIGRRTRTTRTDTHFPYRTRVRSLPPGSSLKRTDAVMQKVAKRILPIPGVKGAVMLAGFDGPSQTLAPNAAAAYIPLESFEKREQLGVSFADIQIGRAHV